MCEAHLGETIDIHAGGVDLQFPHHENEIAQSVCAHGGKPFARFWLHNGMLTFDGSKMSKSVGNIRTVHELIRKQPPEALRLALLSAHYRQPLDWSESLIEQSIRTLDRLYGTLRDLQAVEAADLPIPQKVDAALCDDLNTPLALAEVQQIAARARQSQLALASLDSAENRQAAAFCKSELVAAGRALGLLQQAPAEWFGRGGNADDEARIQSLVDARNEAKQQRDFARADAIRKQLLDEGIAMEDTPTGVRWKRIG